MIIRDCWFAQYHINSEVSPIYLLGTASITFVYPISTDSLCYYNHCTYPPSDEADWYHNLFPTALTPHLSQDYPKDCGVHGLELGRRLCVRYVLSRSFLVSVVDMTRKNLIFAYILIFCQGCNQR